MEGILCYLPVEVMEMIIIDLDPQSFLSFSHSSSRIYKVSREPRVLLRHISRYLYAGPTYERLWNACFNHTGVPEMPIKCDPEMLSSLYDKSMQQQQQQSNNSEVIGFNQPPPCNHVLQAAFERQISRQSPKVASVKWNERYRIFLSEMLLRMRISTDRVLVESNMDSMGSKSHSRQSSLTSPISSKLEGAVSDLSGQLIIDGAVTELPEAKWDLRAHSKDGNLLIFTTRQTLSPRRFQTSDSHGEPVPLLISPAGSLEKVRVQHVVPLHHTSGTSQLVFDIREESGPPSYETVEAGTTHIKIFDIRQTPPKLVGWLIHYNEGASPVEYDLSMDNAYLAIGSLLGKVSVFYIGDILKYYNPHGEMNLVDNLPLYLRPVRLRDQLPPIFIGQYPSNIVRLQISAGGGMLLLQSRRLGGIQLINVRTGYTIDIPHYRLDIESCLSYMDTRLLIFGHRETFVYDISTEDRLEWFTSYDPDKLTSKSSKLNDQKVIIKNRVCDIATTVDDRLFHFFFDVLSENMYSYATRGYAFPLLSSNHYLVYDNQEDARFNLKDELLIYREESEVDDEISDAEMADFDENGGNGSSPSFNRNVADEDALGALGDEVADILSGTTAENDILNSDSMKLPKWICPSYYGDKHSTYRPSIYLQEAMSHKEIPRAVCNGADSITSNGPMPVIALSPDLKLMALATGDMPLQIIKLTEPVMDLAEIRLETYRHCFLHDQVQENQSAPQYALVARKVFEKLPILMPSIVSMWFVGNNEYLAIRCFQDESLVSDDGAFGFMATRLFGGGGQGGGGGSQYVPCPIENMLHPFSVWPNHGNNNNNNINNDDDYYYTLGSRRYVIYLLKIDYKDFGNNSTSHQPLPLSRFYSLV